MRNDELTVQYMNFSVHEKLQENFIRIRFLHCGMINDTESLNSAKSNIMMIRSAIEKEKSSNNFAVQLISLYRSFLRRVFMMK